jgi:hypothetical protein
MVLPSMRQTESSLIPAYGLTSIIVLGLQQTLSIANHSNNSVLAWTTAIIESSPTSYRFLLPAAGIGGPRCADGLVEYPEILPENRPALSIGGQKGKAVHLRRQGK